MRFRLIINGVDFSPYIAAGGITAKKIVRQQRNIVTMDGTLHQKRIVKEGWSVRLITLRDTTMSRLSEALAAADPAAVEYVDSEGKQSSGNFYVTGPQYAVRNVVSGTTYYSGVNFELEAK